MPGTPAWETYPAWPNLAAMMFDLARRWPDRPMLREHRNGAWRTTTWRIFATQAAQLARNLRAAGISAGDRVLIVSANRPEYPIAETALMAIRAVPVPTYITNTQADHAHVLADSGARAAIVSTPALAAIVARAGPLDLLITLEPFPDSPVRTLLWSDLLTGPTDPADIAAEAADIPPGALACLIYTSGTGGAPRGVMLPHRAILSNCRGAFELARPLALNHETYLSFLPLSHSYEHTAGQFFMLSLGTEIAYARGIEHIAADMLTIRPTMLTMVPRVLETIRTRILGAVARQPPWKQRLFAQALAIGLRRLAHRLTLADRLLDPILERLVRREVRARFGGRLRAVICGGARLEPAIGSFFLAFGIPLLQGYGQTEAGPVIAANPPLAIRIDSVGPPLQGVDLRIADDGEILVRGDLVMDGYWGRPAETAAAIQDGWLHTGDIGTLDADRYLRITDRKRDMIVLSGGDNISPARIEGLLIADPAIAQAVIAGEGRSGLTALLVPAEAADDAAVAAAVKSLNARLALPERIRRHVIVPPFTLDNGLLTATQKIRRHLVLKTYAGLLD